VCESLLVGQRVGEGRTATTDGLDKGALVLEGKDRAGGFCLSGRMGKGVGRLLLHFC
jgi:hypothetical protein